MYKQTEEKYKNIKMGFGESSIYDVGCYFVSFTNGMNQKGYSFTPESMNDMLKGVNAWVGQTRNYIDVDHLDDYFPNIFKTYKNINPWNDVPPTQDLLSYNLVVLCQVDARGLGGSGTHFVLLVGIEDGVAVIHDPWTGNTEKVTKRYGKYGNVLSVRIFEVYPYQQNEPPENEKDKKIEELTKEIETLKKNQEEAIKKAVSDTITERDKQWQEAIDKKLKEKDDECTKKLNDQKKIAKDDQEAKDRIWEQKLLTAKTEAVAGMGGFELVARGLGKIFTGKL